VAVFPTCILNSTGTSPARTPVVVVEVAVGQADDRVKQYVASEQS
jgi:hypothetical protein